MAKNSVMNAWLNRANDDFGYASASLEEGLEYYAQICFHFHQACEKYLKAFILDQGLEFKRIHDLLELLEICQSHEAKFSQLKESCLFLNRFYIETRYPVHWPSKFVEEDATQARGHASEIREFVTALLEQ